MSILERLPFSMSSLDPRVNRLRLSMDLAQARKVPLDQFGTFEVFVQPKESRPFQHEGIVHAPNLEMAFILAKETFTRRFLCVSLCVVETTHIHASPTVDGGQDVFSLITKPPDDKGPALVYELYVLPKRGKQHIHAGQSQATSPNMAMMSLREKSLGKGVCNVWAIRSSDFRFTSTDETEFWQTLPDKKFRDAADYKGGDRLKEFIEKNKRVGV